MNQIDLSGRAAIVTGGMGGIGLGIAQRLVASGARVALWDVHAERVADAARQLPGAVGVVVDVTHESQVEAAMEKTQALLGEVAILVASAGVGGSIHEAATYPVDEWRRVIDVNLTGLFLSCAAAVRRMKRSGYGRIVNIASIAGKEGNAMSAAYSASKGGVIAFTKAIAKELATTEIRVNCIAPSLVQTELIGHVPEDVMKALLGKVPLGRFARIDELAALTAWLCSEECSFSTGAVFDISGGRATY